MARRLIKPAGLAAVYPSGVLPDLRGEFIRGWDNGRKVDTDRVLLSVQGDAIRNITGSIPAVAPYGYEQDAKGALSGMNGFVHGGGLRRNKATAMASGSTPRFQCLPRRKTARATLPLTTSCGRHNARIAVRLNTAPSGAFYPRRCVSPQRSPLHSVRQSRNRE